MTVKQLLCSLTTQKGNLVNHIWLDSRGNEAIGEWRTPLWMAEAPPEGSQKPSLHLHHLTRGENDGGGVTGSDVHQEAKVAYLPTSVRSSQRGVCGKHRPSHTPSNQSSA